MEFSNLGENAPPAKDIKLNPSPQTHEIKREHESVDDFEHLEISPAKEKASAISQDPLSGKDSYVPNISSQPKLFDQPNDLHPFSQPADASKDIISGLNEEKMFSSIPGTVDDFLKDSTSEKSISSPVRFEVSKFLEAETRDFKKSESEDASKYPLNSDVISSGSKDSVMENKSSEISNSKLDKFLDQDLLSYGDTRQNDQLIDVFPDKVVQEVTPEPASNFGKNPQDTIFNTPKSVENPFDSMQDSKPKTKEEIPSKPIIPPQPKPIFEDLPFETSSIKPVVSNISFLSDSNESSSDKKSDSKLEPKEEETPVKIPDSLPIQKPVNISKTETDDSEIIKVDEVFRRIGLDSWFKPETLHPQVEALVYWRDPKKSGAVFGSILVALLSLTYYSFISVIAYFSLTILTGTISFKVYKSILQAVQKTSDGHPFKEILDMELTLPQEKVREVTDTAVAHFNAAVIELRRLFLVEDLVDSIKFAILLWCLTRVGGWFNGMTLIIIAFIALFTLPKVYENNKAQVDANLAIVQAKLAEITSKVKAALPIGKKEAEKDKEQ